MTPSLVSLQRTLKDRLLGGMVAPAPPVTSDERANAMQRLGVYERAYRLRLIEVLSDHFPALKAWLGEEEFTRLAHDFVTSHPSRSPNIRWYGEALARFAHGSPAWNERAAVSEMASLEWAMTLSFDAADDEAVGVADVAALDAEAWPVLRIGFVECLQLRPLRWNVAALRRAHDHDDVMPSCEPLRPAATWAIWRHEGSVMHRRLEDDEAVALDAAVRGENFTQLCESLLPFHPETEVALRAAGLFKGWVEARWVCSLRAGHPGEA